MNTTIDFAESLVAGSPLNLVETTSSSILHPSSTVFREQEIKRVQEGIIRMLPQAKEMDTAKVMEIFNVSADIAVEAIEGLKQRGRIRVM